MINYPAIRPTDREFIAGTYSIAAPEFQSSVRYARLTGTKAANPRLNLEYTNITDDEAADILECYLQSMGGFIALSIPDEVVSGISSQLLRDRIKGDSSIVWYFDEPPLQESIYPGVSTVRVRLKALLTA